MANFNAYHSDIELDDYHEDKAKPKFHGRNLKGRYIAAEIEVAKSDAENCEGINETLKRWGARVVSDGSLPHTGYEINTAPARGTKFKREIVEICAALKNAKASVDRSCGLHIHVDARDITYLQLKRVIRVFIECENDVFSMIAPFRSRSGFCDKVGKNVWLKELANNKLTLREFRNELVEEFYGGDLDYAKEDKGHDNRYWAMNIHSWFYRGTLEFRCHQGSVNAKKIVNWGRICEAIINFGAEHTEEELNIHFKDNKEPLASILSPTLKQHFLDRREEFNTRKLERKNKNEKKEAV